MGTSSASLSETCLELQLLLVKNKGYDLKLVQATRYLMTVDCLQFPWKQLHVFVVKLDFAVF